jgi:hypothetical protein
MNERIKELILQSVTFRLDPDSECYEAQVCPEDLESLAELIVAECMDIVSNQTTLDTNEDFREGFNHGLKYVWTDIKKHFGVEE